MTNNADVKAIVIKMMARMSPLIPFDAYCKERWGHLFRSENEALLHQELRQNSPKRTLFENSQKCRIATEAFTY